jgi:hypothetical protein
MSSHRLVVPALAAMALMLVPATSIGESVLVHEGKAGASLDFRIIIPPIMRVLENSHPQELATSSDGEASAEQRLVVQSNLKQGFCVSLRLAAPQLDSWELKTAPQSGVRLSPVADGYRLCGPRPGHYTVLLRHRFGTGESRANALHWPVQTDISAI